MEIEGKILAVVEAVLTMERYTEISYSVQW